MWRPKMSTNSSQPQNQDLFDSNDENNENEIKIRAFDPATAEGELRMRLNEVNKKIEKLEKAQEISQDLLETTIRI